MPTRVRERSHAGVILEDAGQPLKRFEADARGDHVAHREGLSHHVRKRTS